MGCRRRSRTREPHEAVDERRDAEPTRAAVAQQLRREAKAAVKAAEHRRQDRLRDAKRAIEAARKEQAQLIRTAARSVSDAEKAHKRAVAAAEDSVAKGEEGEALAACAPYTLFADQVYTPEGTVWLMPGMQATADASGNLQVEHRPTATRCCLCGCIPAFFLRKRETHDSRRLFISVSGPSVPALGRFDRAWSGLRGSSWRRSTPRLSTDPRLGFGVRGRSKRRDRPSRRLAPTGAWSKRPSGRWRRRRATLRIHAAEEPSPLPRRTPLNSMPREHA